MLRFALAYGFRNIQKVMRDIKRSRVNYDFVEVMACPSGCLNGGGQAKPQDDPTPAPPAKGSAQTVSEGGSKSTSAPVLPAPSIATRRAEHTAAVASSLSEAWRQRQRPSSSNGQDHEVAGAGSGNEESSARSGSPDDDPFTKSVYAWMPSGGSPGSSVVRRWLHTRYHTVPKMEEANPLGIRW